MGASSLAGNFQLPCVLRVHPKLLSVLLMAGALVTLLKSGQPVCTDTARVATVAELSLNCMKRIITWRMQHAVLYRVQKREVSHLAGPSPLTGSVSDAPVTHL